jgi:hypothetical protein
MSEQITQATLAAALTLESISAWVATLAPDAEWDYTEPCGCVLADYLKRRFKPAEEDLLSVDSERVYLESADGTYEWAVNIPQETQDLLTNALHLVNNDYADGHVTDIITVSDLRRVLARKTR